MSCPWIENRKQKNQEKTTKYAPLRWELKQQHKGYTIKQYNIIIDVLGGYLPHNNNNNNGNLAVDFPWGSSTRPLSPGRIGIRNVGFCEGRKTDKTRT